MNSQATLPLEKAAPVERQWDFSSSSATACVTPLRRKALYATPKVFYSPLAITQIQHVVAACEKEVGWWGLVESLPDNTFLVTEIFVPRQTVTDTETDISPEDMAGLVMGIMDRGLDPGKLIYWGHSHVNMGVTPSAQDETQVDQYLANNPIFIREIRNKRGEVKLDVYDTTAGVVFQKVDTFIDWAVDRSTMDAFKASVTANVVERTYPAPTLYNASAKPATVQGWKDTAAETETETDRFGHQLPPLHTVIRYDEHTDEYIFKCGIRVKGGSITVDVAYALDLYLGTPT